MMINQPAKPHGWPYRSITSHLQAKVYNVVLNNLFWILKNIIHYAKIGSCDRAKELYVFIEINIIVIMIIIPFKYKSGTFGVIRNPHKRQGNYRAHVISARAVLKLVYAYLDFQNCRLELYLSLRGIDIINQICCRAHS